MSSQWRFSAIFPRENRYKMIDVSLIEQLITDLLFKIVTTSKSINILHMTTEFIVIVDMLDKTFDRENMASCASSGHTYIYSCFRVHKVIR
jgi:hypothetical protein